MAIDPGELRGREKERKKGVTRGNEGISISTMVGWERYEEFCRGQCRFVISRR
jgi:hypothetical protein